MIGSFTAVANDINAIQTTNDYTGLNSDCKTLADSVQTLLADPVPSAVAAEANTYKSTLAEIQAIGQACESVSNYPELTGAAILLPKAAGTMKTFVAMIG